MKKVSVFVRVGVIVNFEMDEKISRNKISKKVKQLIEDNDPCKLNFHFSGESYIPDGGVYDQEGNGLIDGDINISI